MYYSKVEIITRLTIRTQSKIVIYESVQPLLYILSTIASIKGFPEQGASLSVFGIA